jgi:hypothetical protein
MALKLQQVIWARKGQKSLAKGQKAKRPEKARRKGQKRSEKVRKSQTSPEKARKGPQEAKRLAKGQKAKRPEKASKGQKRPEKPEKAIEARKSQENTRKGLRIVDDVLPETRETSNSMVKDSSVSRDQNRTCKCQKCYKNAAKCYIMPSSGEKCLKQG